MTPLRKGRFIVPFLFLSGFSFYLIGVFLLIAFLSSVFNPNLAKSLLGNYYRADSLLTLFHLVAFFFFLTLFWQKTWLRPTLKTIAFGSFLLSLWTILSALKLHVFGQLEVYSFNGAMAVSFGQPNFLAGYLLVCLPFLLFFFLNTNHYGQKGKKSSFWLLALFAQMKKDLAIKALTISFLLFLFYSQTNIIFISEELIFWLILGIASTFDKV